MKLTDEEQTMLEGKQGRAVRKAMEILTALGKIYGAEALIPVTSVQISGVSYDNLGEAGLQFLSEMAEGGGKARVLATLNPAGMDVENWLALGIPANFAEKQQRVIEAFKRMGVLATCSCTPYLFGNLPRYGEHIAWAESSAVCYANSVLGARTNREGGPSALAAALTGLTPAYGFHVEEYRQPGVTFNVEGDLVENCDFGALGKVATQKMAGLAHKSVPYFQGVREASQEQLKSLCASIATYGGLALFHMEGITPEAALYQPPVEEMDITQSELQQAVQSMSNYSIEEVDFISLGCPHLSIREIARVAELLANQQVRREFWITTSRPVKYLADRAGYTQTIEQAGAILAADTCCVVAPIQGRFKALATDSAKACFYASTKNKFGTVLLPFDQVVRLALTPVKAGTA